VTELCWALGSLEERTNDILKAISVVRNKGLSARVSVVWPTLDLLFVEGTVIGYRGSLSGFSASHKLDVSVIALSDAEALVEMEDKDYTRIDSLESLISLIKEITAREALILKGKVFPVVHLFDPSSVNVDASSWNSSTLDVEDPKEFFYNIFTTSDSVALNIVSLTDRWTLDVLYCSGTVMGSTLYMPEQVETISGADAFVYPLQSPGKWLVTRARPFLCPKMNVRLDPELEKKLAQAQEGVVKL